MTLTEQMKADGWIPWAGDGPCPVGEDVIVHVWLRDETPENWQDDPMTASMWDWTHDGSWTDIIAYRPEQPQ
jgi:hypothetical protein